MYRLLNQAGIKCIYVAGPTHAWNIVKIAGKYYQVDATWDDPVSSDGKNILSHKYFNKSDAFFKKDHVWDTSAYPKCG